MSSIQFRCNSIQFRCWGTCNKTKPVSHFRPLEGEIQLRRRAKFDETLKAIEEHGPTEDRLFSLHFSRTVFCKTCREIKQRRRRNPNSEIAKCKAFSIEIRQMACTDCGARKGSTQADHVRGEKVHALDYHWWAFNGGVDAMKREFHSKCLARCPECHAQRPNFSKYKRRYRTVDEMPEETSSQRCAKKRRLEVDLKQEVVNERKRAIGSCESCGLEVIKGLEHIMHFAHKDGEQVTKENARDTVSALCVSHKSLHEAKLLLDELFLRCRMICGSCHYHETVERNKDAGGGDGGGGTSGTKRISCVCVLNGKPDRI